MHDLVSLYHLALRSGDRQLAAELAAILSRDPQLREQADGSRSSHAARPLWSAECERAVRQVHERLDGLLP